MYQNEEIEALELYLKQNYNVDDFTIDDILEDEIFFTFTPNGNKFKNTRLGILEIDFNTREMKACIEKVDLTDFEKQLGYL